MSAAPSSHRGVWIAPWTGFAGETVLYVMDSENRLVIEPVTIPLTDDRRVVAAGLWALLDAVDLEGSRLPTVAPGFCRVRRGQLSLVE